MAGAELRVISGLKDVGLPSRLSLGKEAFSAADLVRQLTNLECERGIQTLRPMWGCRGTFELSTNERLSFLERPTRFVLVLAHASSSALLTGNISMVC